MVSDQIPSFDIYGEPLFTAIVCSWNNNMDNNIAVSLQRWPNRDPITEVGWNNLKLAQHFYPKLAILKFGRENPYEFASDDPIDRWDSFGLYDPLQIGF